MGVLTTAIANHDWEAIARAILEHPEEVDQRVPAQGWLPIELAARTGNLGTYMRIARLLGDRAGEIDYRGVLVTALRQGCTNYFGGGTPEQAARRVWEQVYEGIHHAFSRDEPDFVFTEEQKKDYVHFISRAGCPTKQALVKLVSEFPA